MNGKLCSLLAFLCMSLLGCATGKDSIIFVTKTSVAIDVDTNPPTFDVGYGRYEGSIAPVAKDGEVLPLLSSISSDGGISSGVFGAGVTQNFGVGNAAVIMSQYLGSNLNPVEGSRTKFASLISSPASVSGTIETGKRYFFGTKTTFGFTTSFAAERGYTPDSISLGYKRKEFAYVPIRQKGDSGSETLSIPSMLATSGTSVSADTNQSGFSVSQFYATGQAANFLAANPTIRNSVITKIIGDDEVAKKLAKAEKEVIGEIDTLQIKADLITLKANNLIISLPVSDLDGALKSMKDMGIADDTDAFNDLDGNGTISEAEKRDRLKKLARVFDGDKEVVAKIEQWISDNS
jgi:hypothetical protein